MLPYTPTPADEIFESSFRAAGVKVLVKREDLNHPVVSGNKWWKLKYNLASAMYQGHKTVLTFGGAYSNHIHATAAAARALGLKSIGVIRGEETLPLNQTLAFAARHGMTFHYIPRELYREKETPEFLLQLQKAYGPFYLLPEGGTNSLAVKGCAEFAHAWLKDVPFDHLFVPVGTGGTMAGLICGLRDTKKITGIAVMRNGDFLREDIARYCRDITTEEFTNWSLLTEYDHGGYARYDDALLSFIREVKDRHHLPLDQVYTAKMAWAVWQEIESGKIRRGETVLMLHTGGLQGLLPALQ